MTPRTGAFEVKPQTSSFLNGSAIYALPPSPLSFMLVGNKCRFFLNGTVFAPLPFLISMQLKKKKIRIRLFMSHGPFFQDPRINDPDLKIILIHSRLDPDPDLIDDSDPHLIQEIIRPGNGSVYK